MNVDYEAKVWSPGSGRIADVFAFDTETTAIDTPDVVPEYVIGTAFDGRGVYFIRRQDIGIFWSLHQECTVFMHTASFDLKVVENACTFSFASMVEAGRIRDVAVYFRLVECALKGEIPQKYNLGLLCQLLLGGKLNKEDGVRTDFGRFYMDGKVNYNTMPAEYLAYAACDAIATFRIGELLEPQCRDAHLRYTPLPHNGIDGTNGITAQWGWLGHDIQLRGDIALQAIRRNGISIDPVAVHKAEERLNAELGATRAILERFGYFQGQPGNRGVYDKLIGEFEQQKGIRIPRSPKTHAVSQAEEDLAPLADHEFVAAFLRVKKLGKLSETYISHFKVPENRAHPRYTLMVRTGRTSCSSPNVQNLPREGGVRECLVPKEGHVFIACDYSTLELCTLSQITYSRYGKSAMRDLINSGVDLHRRLASIVLSKPESEVTKEDRQKAKALNFGLPGGMGLKGLQAYAQASYGVDIALDEAERWRAVWLSLFPELQEYLQQEDDLARLGETLDMDSHPDASTMLLASAAAGMVTRVAGGASGSSMGRVFSKDEIDWAWKQIAEGRAGSVKALAESIRLRRGSPELRKAVMPGMPAIIPTGRVRADCSYTERHNWPFQALAADGAKLALYGLMRAGYRVAAFIHDEVLVEVPEREDYRKVAEDISRIMIDSMRLVCPDVEIRTEYTAMKRWCKDAKAVYDEHKRLIPFEDAALREEKHKSL